MVVRKKGHRSWCAGPIHRSYGAVCPFLRHNAVLLLVHRARLIQQGGSLPFQILRSLVTPPLKYWAGEKAKGKDPWFGPNIAISGTRFWLCPGPRSGLNGSMIWYFSGDQRFVTIFVILRCHRFLCEGVAQIKEVSSGGNTHMFLCKLSQFFFSESRLISLND